MQSLVPDLEVTPVDEIAAFSMWYRLSPETLSEVLPYCVEARQQGNYRTYTVPHDKLANLMVEQAVLRQDLGISPCILKMITAPASCFVNDANLTKYGKRNLKFELVFELTKKNPDALLLISGGNPNLLRSGDDV